MLCMLRRKQTTNHNTMKEINMKILQKKDAWTEDNAKVLRLLSRWKVYQYPRCALNIKQGEPLTQLHACQRAHFAVDLYAVLTPPCVASGLRSPARFSAGRSTSPPSVGSGKAHSSYLDRMLSLKT